MGYSRAGSLSLSRAFLPQTFSGSTSAGSTCWPSTACLAIVVGHYSLLNTSHLFDPDEAEQAGAFAEDALSLEDAAESCLDLADGSTASISHNREAS
jgi:hypothetical protein